MSKFKDQAICIRLIDWSETSQVVALLSENHGKFRGVAKGSKRTSPSSVARFSGGFELLTQGQIVATIKPTAELANLTEWDLQQPHWHLRSNLRTLNLAYYAADLVNAMLPDHEPHPGAYQALDLLLEQLADPDAASAALARFQWDLLLDCGYRPEVQVDAATGAQLPQGASYLFDPRLGGLTAASATTLETDAGPWRVRAQTVAVLRWLDQQPSLSGAEPLALQRVNRLLCVYARSILDRALPTMDYILQDG